MAPRPETEQALPGLRAEGIARGPVDGESVVAELVDRVTERLRRRPLAVLVNEACFLEEKRLRGASDTRDRAYLETLRSSRRQLATADEATLLEIVRTLVEHYAREIHGHFDGRIYRRATRILPPALALMLRRQSPIQAIRRGFAGELDLADRVRCSGAIDTFDRLVERGTVVLVPTHLSNLDSPVIGFALHAAGLPPVIYGAGINLFTNWLLSYFMDRLGAYKVDRTKTHTLYKVALKEYSTLALRRRWHSLFFPGGTRARSGAVETRLKKGLMGTAVEAFRENLRDGADKPRLFFVPATINYTLVLEAETLIDDALQAEGKSRFIITDDEFSRPDKVLSFVWNMMELSNPVEIVFGRPLDPFGNPVDDDGNSVDPQGRPFDPAGYVMRDGEVVDDPQRDRVYTERLAAAIGRAFLQETILVDTHVLAGAVHRVIEAGHPNLDIYERLLLGDDERRLPVATVDGEIDRLQQALRSLEDEGGVRLGDVVRDGAPADVRGAAIDHFARYHSHRAVTMDGHEVFVEGIRLALYYANRLQGYPLPSPTEAAR